jgi:GntR family transcriptional regulator
MSCTAARLWYDVSMPASRRPTQDNTTPSLRKSRAARLPAHPPRAHPQLLAGATLDVPLYKEVKRLMIEAISGAEWVPGKAIPAEWALAERFQVAVGTVRKAVDELVAENILVRQQGRGTFIAAHNRERLMFHFFHIVRRDGSKQQPDVHFQSFRSAKADTDEAAALSLSEGEAVFRIRNLLLIADEPIIADAITVPQALFPSLSLAQFRDRPNTIYHLYQNAFGITVVRSAERLRATLADAETAKALRIKPNAPLLEIRRVALSFDNAPVEYRRSLVNTERYEYFSDLAKGS